MSDPTLEKASEARVLIVDDDERNAFAAVQALESLGYELVVARSGEDALRRLISETFAVILLDLHMPGMDGYETAELIRQHRRTRDIPIVFLTAVFRDETHLFKAYSAGAVDVVFKPVDPFVLRSKVQVLADLHLQREAVRRQGDLERALLRENARIQSERLKAERALRLSQTREEAILRALPVVVVHSRTAAPPFDLLFISNSIEALTGFSPSRLVGEAGLATGRIHPDDLDHVIASVSGALTTGAYACEFRFQCADGGYRTFRDQGVLAPPQEGEPPQIIGALVDHTERRQLEERLLQAGKMEAVGQLTGGIAHDFNNLLTVILGNLDLVLPHVAGTERTERRLNDARKAAERGQTLTRQLLAFSRQQKLSPVTVDLRQRIVQFAPLMQQAVGEGVTLDLDLPPTPLVARIDAAHLESALLNLAVNARDAMDGAGVLRLGIGRRPAAPGESDAAPNGWAEIRVSDTGPGMSPEVASRIFEPFFTTKAVGKGSGLGLSQVYGFVSQSGGQVSVASAAGEGAEFVILLPASDAQPEAEPERPAREPAPPAFGSERVLIVEDDPAVRELAVRMFESLGYRTATAQDGLSALALLRGRRRIDLLFSDVVMPGQLSGVDLARQAVAMRTGLKVLLTSGYAGSRPIDSEFGFIDKPYERAQLAARVRAVLDAPSAGAASGAPGRRNRVRRALRA